MSDMRYVIRPPSMDPTVLVARKKGRKRFISRVSNADCMYCQVNTPMRMAATQKKRYWVKVKALIFKSPSGAKTTKIRIKAIRVMGRRRLEGILATRGAYAAEASVINKADPMNAYGSRDASNVPRKMASFKDWRMMKIANVRQE